MPGNDEALKSLYMLKVETPETQNISNPRLNDIIRKISGRGHANATMLISLSEIYCN
jgi:hypothetical protein